MPMQLPKTVIVAITTHGQVMLNPNPQVFSLPPKMTLTSISSVSPGVCNFTFPDAIKYLIQHLYNNAPTDLIEKDVFPYAKQIASLFKTIQDKDDEISLTQKTDPNRIDPEYKHYWHHNDKSFEVDMYTEEVLNKKFIVLRDELEPTDGYYNKINIIVPGENVYNVLNIKDEDERAEMTTQDLMDMLKGKGVENVIMLDLSCSPFDSELNDRGIRAMARSLHKKGLHGGIRGIRAN
jgi:hypothetical protein